MKVSQLKFLDKALTRVLGWLPRKKSLSPKPQAILVIKLSAMGDAFCLMPAVRQLAMSLEDVQIDWLTTTRTNPEIFQSLGYIRRTLLLPTSPLKLAGFVLRHFFALKRYDLIIDFDQYYQVSELIAYLGTHSAGLKAPLKGATFSLAVDYDEQANEKLVFRKLAESVIHALGDKPQAYSFQLPELLQGFSPSHALRSLANELGRRNKPVLIIYPGSGVNALYRRWDLDNYDRLLGMLGDTVSVLIAGGPDEVHLKEILHARGLGDIDHVNKWSLREWLWLFRHVGDLFVGNDAGLLHLAESQGLKIVGLFGPSLYAKWGSINPASTGIEMELPCRPCLKNYAGQVPSHCHRGDEACLSELDVESVLAVVRQELAPTGGEARALGMAA